MSLETTIADAVKTVLVRELSDLLSAKSGLLTEEAAMKMLGVNSKRTMVNYRNEGLVAYQPTGSNYYYFEKDIVQFVKHKGRAL